MDSLEKLQDDALPPYEAFFSTLKNSNTLEEGKVRYGTEHEKSMKKINMKINNVECNNHYVEITKAKLIVLA